MPVAKHRPAIADQDGLDGVERCESPHRLDGVRAVDQLRVGVDLCAQLPLLAVLPDVLAQAHAGRLWRLPCDFLAAGDVHAIHRRSLSGKPNAVAALLTALA